MIMYRERDGNMIVYRQTDGNMSIYRETEMAAHRSRAAVRVENVLSEEADRRCRPSPRIRRG